MITLMRFVCCSMFGFFLADFIIDGSRVAEGVMLTAILLYVTTLPNEEDK